jgi:hypothetical protein
MSDEREREVLGRLLGSAGPDIGCDGCFELLDEYVELELAGVDPDERLPGMRGHFDGCPACREELELLRELASGGGRS